VNQDEIRQKLDAAIQEFMKCDADLLIRDVNERSITHMLAMYLQDEFSTEWMVDCGFDENGENGGQTGSLPHSENLHSL
jgi:hypothetical protein